MHFKIKYKSFCKFLLNINNILSKILISGSEVLPIIEGGKGIGVSNGITAGNFALAGAVGTFSGVNADYLDENGEYVPIEYKGKTRYDRHQELVEYGIKAAISQARRAFDIAQGQGRIHMNVLWEMGSAQRVLHGVLEKANGLIHGITCGAGMPYQLSEIAEKYNVYYYPIVSSMRALRALWKRSYGKVPDLLGGVVYECPWRAGGHNGLSNAEDPKSPQDPYLRVMEIRKFMNESNLQSVPIIIAGGIWNVNQFSNYLNNKEIGPIAFQFGTRPMYTKEYPISEEWKKKLFTLKEGDVYLNKFSPTGFYSSAVENAFIKDLIDRESSQVKFSNTKTNDYNYEFNYGERGRSIFISLNDKEKVENRVKNGFSEIIKTPDETIIFVTPVKKEEISKDQRDCMGCISYCRFSNWTTMNENYSTGILPDPRSFCIQKTLQNAIHTKDIENNLMFAGSQVFNFSKDEWYQGGKFMPTIKELIERISTGF